MGSDWGHTMYMLVLFSLASTHAPSKSEVVQIFKSEGQMAKTPFESSPKNIKGKRPPKRKPRYVRKHGARRHTTGEK